MYSFFCSIGALKDFCSKWKCASKLKTQAKVLNSIETIPTDFQEEKPILLHKIRQNTSKFNPMKFDQKKKKVQPNFLKLNEEFRFSWINLRRLFSYGSAGSVWIVNALRCHFNLIHTTNEWNEQKLRARKMTLLNVRTSYTCCVHCTITQSVHAQDEFVCVHWRYCWKIAENAHKHLIIIIIIVCWAFHFFISLSYEIDCCWENEMADAVFFGSTGFN